MDLNLFVVAGRIAAPPELREFDDGSRLLRYLITATTTEPSRRVDVLPIVKWDPPTALVADPGEPGRPVWACGAVQRRFWSDTAGRRSRIELVASVVEMETEVVIAVDDAVP